MNKSIETEHKCLLTKKHYQKLLEFYKYEYQEITQKNIYFIDQKNMITTNKAVLRIRKINNDSTITFKIKRDGKLFEYEKNTDDLLDLDLLEVLATYNIIPPFTETANLTTIRRLINLPKGELCLDENHYNNQIDYEVEYEEKESHDGLSILKSILQENNINYQENTTSKFQRATK